MYALAQGLLIGFLGSSATFGPLLADISHWFERRRGLAVSIVACGNYLAGTDLAADRAAPDRDDRLAPDAHHDRRSSAWSRCCR